MSLGEPHVCSPLCWGMPKSAPNNTPTTYGDVNGWDGATGPPTALSDDASDGGSSMPCALACAAAWAMASCAACAAYVAWYNADAAAAAPSSCCDCADAAAAAAAAAVAAMVAGDKPRDVGAAGAGAVAVALALLAGAP